MLTLLLLPPENEVWGKVIFLHQFVILFTGWGVRGCSWGGGHAWLLWGGHAWLLRGEHVWLLGGACAVLFGGACVVAPGGACMVALGGGMCGCSGGMHGFIWGVCMVLFGGVCGFIQGACVVLFGGDVWFYLGGMRGFIQGVHAWFFQFFRIQWDTVNERAVRILLECILVLTITSAKKKRFGHRNVQSWDVYGVHFR